MARLPLAILLKTWRSFHISEMAQQPKAMFPKHCCSQLLMKHQSCFLFKIISGQFQRTSTAKPRFLYIEEVKALEFPACALMATMYWPAMRQPNYTWMKFVKGPGRSCSKHSPIALALTPPRTIQPSIATRQRWMSGEQKIQ